MSCKAHSKPVLVLCPVCEGRPIAYAGKIIYSTCEGCINLVRDTSADRVGTHGIQ